MDKNTIISLSIIINTTGVFNIPNANKYLLILNYCIECGKDKDLSNRFISAIMNNTYYIHYCFIIALGYYERKFNICKLYSRGKNLISIF